MVGETELADHADAQRLGLDPLELDAVVEFIDLDAVQHAEEIEVPPRAAELAVGGELEADLFLLSDHVADLAIFHRLERLGGDLALLLLGARLVNRGRTQETAYMIGTERRLGSFHERHPLG